MGVELMLGVAGESSGSASAPPPPPHLNVGDRCGPNSGVEMRAGSVLNVCSTLKWGAKGADGSPGVHHQDGGRAREQALMHFLNF